MNVIDCLRSQLLCSCQTFAGSTLRPRFLRGCRSGEVPATQQGLAVGTGPEHRGDAPHPSSKGNIEKCHRELGCGSTRKRDSASLPPKTVRPTCSSTTPNSRVAVSAPLKRTN